MQQNNIEYRYSLLIPCNHNRRNGMMSLVYNSNDRYFLYAHLEIKYYCDLSTDEWYKKSIIKCSFCDCDELLKHQIMECVLVRTPEPDITLPISIDL